MRRILLSYIILCMCTPLLSQRLSIGTDLARVLDLGTLNVDASAAVSRSVSIHVGAELNPWTFRGGSPDTQFQMRSNSYWAGARWWPWHIYSGWWGEGSAGWSVYNGGGILSRETEEGEAWSIGLRGGYAVMLSDRWNLDLGAGVRGGWKSYTVYACPQCGAKTSEGEKSFIVPDARIAVQLIF